MKKALFILPFFLIFVFTFSVFSQIPTATPPSLPEIDDELVKISTSLIQVDITITDKKGNVVTDLKAEDFEVYENGKKQDITNFSFVSVENKSNAVEIKNSPNNSKDKNAIPIPPVKLKPEQVRRTYALVVDDLGLSFESIANVRQSLRKFIEEQIQEGDLVAILRTGSGIGTLQSFTSDKRQLLASIEKVRWNGQGRSGISAFPPITQSTDILVQSNPNDVENTETGKDQIQSGDKKQTVQEQTDDLRNENFSIGTLGSLNFIIRGMRELPGRKSLLLFSDGFVLTSGSGTDKGLGRQNRVFESMRVLADLANRSSVIIYTLDPRGLVNPLGLTAEDNLWDPKFTVGDFGPGGDPLTATLEDRNNQLQESQASLRYLAEETGGVTFTNQNNLGRGLRQAVADQSSYYLLGYQPDEETFDPKKNKFNKLEIKVLRPDLRVRYRSGFFGITDEKIQNVAQTPQQKLLNALTSPFGANGVNLRFYPVYQNDEKIGNLVQALVYIDAKDLTFTEANGKRKANFDLVAMTFGDNGSPIDRLYKNYTLEVGEKVYQNMLANGFVYNLTVPIQKAGGYQFRIALRDGTSDKVGSASQFIEVPNFSKKMTLSNLVLDNFTPEEWQKIKLGGNRDDSQRSILLDTTLRQFKRGTVLRYDYVIYNPKKSQQIINQIRLIRDGKVLYEEKFAPIETAGQTDLMRLPSFGAITLGKNLEAGSYILQAVVIDKNAKEKSQLATQFVEFEIIE